MIFSSTYSTVNATLLWSTSALVGTIGVRIIDGAGNSIKGRTTSGITEPIVGSGFYVAAIDLTALSSAPAPGHYYLFWDDGSVTPGHVATEDLMLHNTMTLGTALRMLDSAKIGLNAENVAVGVFIP